jgi:hypothetical protein
MRRLLAWSPPLVALAVVAGLLGSAASRADEVEAPALVNGEALRAIDEGLRFLARIQEPDGSWKSNAGKKINDTYRVFEGGESVSHVGVTALAVLALLAGGHAPGRGPYGDTLDRAIGFLLAHVQPETGYIAANRTRMYSHAFATLALAEVYGVTRRPAIRERLERAVEFTAKCQNDTGGWRYVPFTSDSDMSVTVCQVVALRAARNVGIRVPQSVIDRALRYVIESAITDREEERGAFWYQPQDQTFNRDSFALCAAGLTTLFQAGIYDDDTLERYIQARGNFKDPPPRIRDCVAYMRQTYFTIWERYPNHYFYYYGNYYAAQAMYQIGSKEPETWASWYSMVRDHLLQRMRSSGVPASGLRESWWESNVDRTHAYGTATALLILQLPLDHLPIHQR